eukprot:gene2503-3248_t
MTYCDAPPQAWPQSLKSVAAEEATTLQATPPRPCVPLRAPQGAVHSRPPRSVEENMLPAASGGEAPNGVPPSAVPFLRTRAAFRGVFGQWGGASSGCEGGDWAAAGNGAQHEQEALEDEENLKALEDIHRNIPGVVFHFWVSEEAHGVGEGARGGVGVRCLYCSAAAQDTLGLPAEDLLADFGKLRYSLAPVDQGSFARRFEELIGHGKALEWKGRLQSPAMQARPPLSNVFYWACVFRSRVPKDLFLAAVPSVDRPWIFMVIKRTRGSAPLLGTEGAGTEYVGHVRNCSERDEAQKLSIEREMYSSDMRFFHFAQNSLATVLERSYLLWEALQLAPGAHGVAAPQGEIARLLVDLRRACENGKRSCHLRPLLNSTFSGNYKLRLTEMGCAEVVQHYAEEFGLDTTPLAPGSPLNQERVHIDLELLSIVLNNLVANAIKYGARGIRPRFQVARPDPYNVAFQLWNAPGPNHASFMQNPSQALRAPSSMRQEWMSDGLGIESIRMCLACTNWTLGYQVTADSTSFWVLIPCTAGQPPPPSRAETQDAETEHRSDLAAAAPVSEARSDLSASTVSEPVRPGLRGGRQEEAAGAGRPMFPPGVLVAVLDDSTMMRATYRAQLKQMGVKKFWIEGATREEIHQFAARAMKNRVDLVVLDQNLSEVLGAEEAKCTTGSSIMRELRAAGFAGLCVTRTAMHSDEACAQYRTDGFDDVLPKTTVFARQLAAAWPAYSALLERRMRLAWEEGFQQAARKAAPLHGPKRRGAWVCLCAAEVMYSCCREWPSAARAEVGLFSLAAVILGMLTSSAKLRADAAATWLHCVGVPGMCVWVMARNPESAHAVSGAIDALLGNWLLYTLSHVSSFARCQLLATVPMGIAAGSLSLLSQRSAGSFVRDTAGGLVYTGILVAVSSALAVVGPRQAYKCQLAEYLRMQAQQQRRQHEGKGPAGLRAEDPPQSSPAAQLTDKALEARFTHFMGSERPAWRVGCGLLVIGLFPWGSAGLLGWLLCGAAPPWVTAQSLLHLAAGSTLLLLGDLCAPWVQLLQTVLVWCSQALLLVCLANQEPGWVSVLLPVLLVLHPWFATTFAFQWQPWYQNAVSTTVALTWLIAQRVATGAARPEIDDGGDGGARMQVIDDLWTTNLLLQICLHLGVSQEVRSKESEAREDFRRRVLLGGMEGAAQVGVAGGDRDLPVLHGWELHLGNPVWESEYLQQKKAAFQATCRKISILKLTGAMLSLQLPRMRPAAPEILAWMLGTVLFCMCMNFRPALQTIKHCFSWRLSEPLLLVLMSSRHPTNETVVFFANVLIVVTALSQGTRFGLLEKWTSRVVVWFLVWAAICLLELRRCNGTGVIHNTIGIMPYLLMMLVVAALVPALTHRFEKHRRLAFLHEQLQRSEAKAGQAEQCGCLQSPMLLEFVDQRLELQFEGWTHAVRSARTARHLLLMMPLLLLAAEGEPGLFSLAGPMAALHVVVAAALLLAEPALPVPVQTAQTVLMWASQGTLLMTYDRTLPWCPALLVLLPWVAHCALRWQPWYHTAACVAAGLVAHGVMWEVDQTAEPGGGGEAWQAAPDAAVQHACSLRLACLALCHVSALAVACGAREIERAARGEFLKTQQPASGGGDDLAAGDPQLHGWAMRMSSPLHEARFLRESVARARAAMPYHCALLAGLCLELLGAMPSLQTAWAEMLALLLGCCLLTPAVSRALPDKHFCWLLLAYQAVWIPGCLGAALTHQTSNRTVHFVAQLGMVINVGYFLTGRVTEMVSWIAKAAIALLLWLCLACFAERHPHSPSPTGMLNLGAYYREMLAGTLLLVAMACRNERGRRLAFLRGLQEESGPARRSTSADASAGALDGLAQTQTLLHFVDSALEDRFAKGMRAARPARQVAMRLLLIAVLPLAATWALPALYGIEAPWVGALAALYSAGAVAIYAAGNGSEQWVQALQCWLMWASQGLVLLYGTSVHNLMPVLLVLQPWLVCARAFQWQPWYHHMLSTLASLAAHGAWGMTMGHDKEAPGQVGALGGGGVPAAHAEDAWLLSFVALIMSQAAFSLNLYLREQMARTEFLPTKGSHAPGASQHGALHLRGWELHLGRFSWERQYVRDAMRLERGIVCRSTVLVTTSALVSQVLLQSARCASTEVGVLLFGQVVYTMLASSAQVPRRWHFVMSFWHLVLFPAVTIGMAIRHHGNAAVVVLANGGLLHSRLECISKSSISWMRQGSVGLLMWKVLALAHLVQGPNHCVIHDTIGIGAYLGLTLTGTVITTALAYQTEKRRRLAFLWNKLQQCERKPLHSAATGASDEDELAQTQTLLYFVDGALEDRFAKGMRAARPARQVAMRLLLIAVLPLAATWALPALYGIEAPWVGALAALYSAGAVAIYAAGNGSEQWVQALQCWLMWASQGLVLLYGNAMPEWTAGLLLGQPWLVSATTFQWQPWYHSAACTSAGLMAQGLWELIIRMQQSEERSAPGEYGYDLWAFYHVAYWGIHLSICSNARAWECSGRENFFGEVQEELAGKVRKDVGGKRDPNCPTSATSTPADALQLHGWELHLGKHSWELAYWVERWQMTRRKIRLNMGLSLLGFSSLHVLGFLSGGKSSLGSLTAWHSEMLPMLVCHTIYVICGSSTMIPIEWLPTVVFVGRLMLWPFFLISNIIEHQTDKYAVAMASLALVMLSFTGTTPMGGCMSWMITTGMLLLVWIALAVGLVGSSGTPGGVLENQVGLARYLAFLLAAVVLAGVMAFHTERSRKVAFASHRQRQERQEQKQQAFRSYLDFLHDAIPGAVLMLELRCRHDCVTQRITYLSSYAEELLAVPAERICDDFTEFTRQLSDSSLVNFRRSMESAAQLALPLNWVGALRGPISQRRWINLTASCVRVDDPMPGDQTRTVTYSGILTDYTLRFEMEELQKQRTLRLSDNHLFHAVKNNFAAVEFFADRIQEDLAKHGCHHAPVFAEMKGLCVAALQGQSDCHSRTMLNNVLDGSYQSHTSWVHMTRFVESVALKFGLDFDGANAPSAETRACIDERLCSLMLISFFSAVIEEGEEENARNASSIKVTLAANGSDVVLSVLLTAAMARHRRKQADFSGSDSTSSREQLKTSTSKRERLPSRDSDEVKDDLGTRFDVCKRFVEQMSFQFRSEHEHEQEQEHDPMPYYSITMPQILSHGGPPNLAEQPSRAMKVQHGGVQNLPPGVRVAALDDCVLSRKILKMSLEKLQLGTLWVLGATRDEVLGFAAFVAAQKVNVVILDQWLTEVLDQSEAETVSGITILSDLRRQGFKGMAILRTGDDHDDYKMGVLLDRGFNVVIGKRENIGHVIRSNWDDCYLQQT